MNSHTNSNHDETENEIEMTVGLFYSWVYQLALCQASSNTVHPFSVKNELKQVCERYTVGGVQTEIKIRLISTSLLNET